MGSFHSSVENMAINHRDKSEREEKIASKDNDRKLAKRKATRKRQRINRKQRNRKALKENDMPGTFPLPSPPTTPPTIILSDSDEPVDADISDDDDGSRSSSHSNSNSNSNSNSDNDNQIIHTTTNNISLTERDLLTLKPGKWLNDTIIDYSLKLIEDKCQHNQLITVSSTFFFTKLKSAKERNLDIYKETKTWINYTKLRQSKTWFIPVCQNHHWFLIAVAFPFKSKSFIYAMDSLNIDRTSEAKLIVEFLEKIHTVETNTPIRKIPQIYQTKIPRQQNMNDCGLHVLRSFEVSILRKKFITRLLQGEIVNQAEIDAFWLQHPVISRHDLEYHILKYAMDSTEE
ncbi:hypothetical protein BD408DRAFT_415125 [Parasitella parasitica]|nr:hypothetical protein BD408DRAFT_415125 [Parasitella parasitica]